MPDKKESDKKGKAAESGTQEKQVAVNAQYIKDFSFENPGAPGSLLAGQENPKIDISVDVRAAAAGDDVYEVTLLVNAKAARQKDGKENNVFLLELSYAGIFTLKGVSDQEREPALLIFCPSILFPFARRIIADATRDGGFPPLMLDPIDFGRIYAQHKSAAVEKEG